MHKSILYPFKISTDFSLGYAWTTELTRRLKGELSLFSTIDSSLNNSSEPIADLYHALADAQGHYIKNFQLLPLRLKPVKSNRRFLDGEFNSTLTNFLEQNPHDLIVLQSNLVSNELMKKIINSNSEVIVLSSPLILSSSENKKNRAELFVEIFRDAALYNISSSFYKTIGQDTGLFNSIAAFFRK